MISKVYMPKLGQTMEEGTIEKWRVKENDQVKRGDILLEITTDKATLEVESYSSGEVKKILVKPGDTVPINTVIALLGDAEDEVTDQMISELSGQPSAAAPAQASEAAKADSGAAPAATPSVQAPAGRIFASPRAKKRAQELGVSLQTLSGSGPNGRIVERDVVAYAEKMKSVKITPVARKLAADRGVDLLGIKGTGPGGKITREDVEKAARAPAAKPAAAVGQKVEMTPMRRTIAERMSQSKREIPHYYVTMDADATELIALRTSLNSKDATKISFNDLLIKACAMAMKEFPAVNASWTNGAIATKSAINIGLAVGLDQGLIVPVVRGADALTLEQVAQQTPEPRRLPGRLHDHKQPRHVRRRQLHPHHQSGRSMYTGRGTHGGQGGNHRRRH